MFGCLFTNNFINFPNFYSGISWSTCNFITTRGNINWIYKIQMANESFNRTILLYIPNLYCSIFRTSYHIISANIKLYLSYFISMSFKSIYTLICFKIISLNFIIMWSTCNNICTRRKDNRANNFCRIFNRSTSSITNIPNFYK